MMIEPRTAAERLLDALSELWNNDDDDQPTGTTAHALVVAALRDERLRVVEQVRAVTLPFVEHTDMDAAMACHTALHAVLDAVAGLSGEEPSE